MPHGRCSLGNICGLQRPRHSRQTEEDNTSRGEALTHDQLAEVIILRKHYGSFCQRERQYVNIRHPLSDILTVDDCVAITLKDFGNAP